MARYNAVPPRASSRSSPQEHETSRLLFLASSHRMPCSQPGEHESIQHKARQGRLVSGNKRIRAGGAASIVNAGIGRVSCFRCATGVARHTGHYVPQQLLGNGIECPA